MFSVGATHDTVAVPLVGVVVPVVPVTVMLNADSDAVAVPSATLITIFEVVPTSVSFGLPESCPVEVLNVAQEGAFWMEKVMAPPSESLAVGVKLYWVPTVTPVVGVPLIVAVVAVAGLPTSFAVELVGFTATPSPPPQPTRASDASKGAPRALISLKLSTPFRQSTDAKARELRHR